MKWLQRDIELRPKTRGMHLVTSEIEANIQELSNIKIGLAHIFICHTSASLTINENASPDVRQDLDRFLDKTVPENESYYTHIYEGSDDMPAHIKCSLFGSGLTIPIANGRFKLGVWQGIYLCEHRNRGGQRKLVVTLMGE